MSADRRLAENGAARLAEAGLEAWQLGGRGALQRALGWSDFIYRVLLNAGPEQAGALLESAARPCNRHTLAAEGVHAGLAIVALRELTGLQGVRESLLALSALAEATVRNVLQRTAGAQEANMIVFGLGKLGGRELNFYSDLDLVFAHTGRGEREESRAMRAARRLLDGLEGGFRIDLRLRPFGQSGPLSMGIEAMEAYFQNHGRDWERYAWLKARPVAGGRTAGRQFLQRLRPFIYRRYLDYHAVEALREMKRQIEVEAGGRLNDIKQGPGGIREIEFVVQAFQLVRGGRERPLAGSGLRGALAAAGRLGHLEPESAKALGDAYYFLRRVENRLQMAALAPVHVLPEDPERRELLAASLGYPEASVFEAELCAHRHRVRDIFTDILGAAPPGGGVRGAAERLWQGEGAAQAAAELGLVSAVEALETFRNSRPVRLMGPRARRALDRLAPELISAAATQGAPDAALQRLLSLLSALVRRSAYLALLVERRPARARLVELIGQSDWITERLAATPAALDELLDERECAPAAPIVMAQQLRALPRLMLSEEDAATQLRELNELQRLKVAAGLVDGHLDDAGAECILTRLAEHSVRAALQLAGHRMQVRHGELHAPLLAIAYGKLGSRELGLASDLDLVFVHAAREAEATGGLAAETYLARLTQRALSLLNQPTLVGPLYQVDTRLRPEGEAGLLLSSFEAWQRYQSENAWLWERQALLRARPVAGSAQLARRFHTERMQLLCRPVEPQRLRAELAAMRTRVAQAGPRRTANGAALLDGEFLAAYWLLLHAPRDRALVRHTSLTLQMAALARRGHIAEAPSLAEALAILRASGNRRVLGLRPDEGRESRARALIARRWAETFSAESPPSL